MPIVHIDESFAEHGNRSGILLQVGDMKFIVTAAHHLIYLNEHGTVPAIVMPEKGKRPVPIVTECWWTTIDDNEDLAVAKLEQTTVDMLGDAYRYLNVSDLRSRARERRGFYLIMGFPEDMIRPDKEGHRRIDSWKYLTHQVDDTSVVENYDPKLHLVLKYQRETHNSEGGRVHPPAMSGCGIWYIDTPTPLMATRGMLKLVAIQNRWHKQHEYAKGTWIDVVLTIIWKYFSDARGPLRFYNFEI